MLRFIVYRYISYKDRKISHASLLTLRHHLSQLPPALLPSSLPHDLPLPYSTQPYYLFQPYYPPSSPTTCPCRTPHSPTPTSLTYHLHLPYSQPYDLHTTYPTTRLSIPDPPTLPMCTLLPIHSCALTCYTYYYYPAHTCHVPLSTPPSPSPPQMYHATSISYRLYHTALPIAPLSSSI